MANENENDKVLTIDKPYLQTLFVLLNGSEASHYMQINF
jgi:hypothetical protein